MIMDNKSNILWITQTAIFIALLIVLLIITAPFGNIIVTELIVNMLLMISVMACGFMSAPFIPRLKKANIGGQE